MQGQQPHPSCPCTIDLPALFNIYAGATDTAKSTPNAAATEQTKARSRYLYPTTRRAQASIVLKILCSSMGTPLNFLLNNNNLVAFDLNS